MYISSNFSHLNLMIRPTLILSFLPCCSTSYIKTTRWITSMIKISLTLKKLKKIDYCFQSDWICYFNRNWNLSKTWILRNSGNFLNQRPTEYSSLKFDADDDFFSVQIDTLHVINASSLPCQDPSAILTNKVQEPILFFSMIPHPQWHFPQRNKPVKESFWKNFVNLRRENKKIPKTILSTYKSHRTLEYWKFH